MNDPLHEEINELPRNYNDMFQLAQTLGIGELLNHNPDAEQKKLICRAACVLLSSLYDSQSTSRNIRNEQERESHLCEMEEEQEFLDSNCMTISDEIFFKNEEDSYTDKLLAFLKEGGYIKKDDDEITQLIAFIKSDRYKELEKIAKEFDEYMKILLDH